MRSPRYKRYYTDYCSHMWRFFILNMDNPAVPLKQECDARAFSSCKKVYDQLNRDEQRILQDVYTLDPWTNRLSDIVLHVAQKRTCEPDAIWGLLTRSNHTVAKIRGLI